MCWYNLTQVGLYQNRWQILNVSLLQGFCKHICSLRTISVPLLMHRNVLLELILQNDIMDDCNSSHFSFITVPLSLALKGGKTIVCNWIGSSLNNLCQKGVLHSTACEYAWFCFWWVQIQAAVNNTLYLKEPNRSQRNSISDTTWIKHLKQKVSQSTYGSRPILSSFRQLIKKVTAKFKSLLVF